MRSLSGVPGMLCVFLGCLLASASASASNESLSFRRTASGSIEAVVSGTTDGCPPIFLPPDGVVAIGATLTITSQVAGGGCYLPHTPMPYSVTADLGILANQSYQVVWNQPFDAGAPLQLSAALSPAAIVGGTVAAAPALSWWGLAAMGLALGIFAVCHINFNRSRM